MSVPALVRTLRKFCIKQIIRDEYGATAIEYGLIAAAISIAIIAAVFAVGEDLSGLFNLIGSNISSAQASAN